MTNRKSKINIKLTWNGNREIRSGKKQGNLKSILVFSDHVPIMITKAFCEHTDPYKSCPQLQQMTVRQKSGQYAAKISVDTVYTLCSMYTQFGILKSNIVTPYL